ncbi:MAG: regulatory protein RecX [Cyclobacteriaceae bacterium]
MQSVGRTALAQKIRHFCAFQERSHSEVRKKLLDLGAKGDTLEEIIVELIADGFLNEERFAKAYAGGKFRMKHWGRIKIERGLQNHGVSARCIATGMKEIPEDDYLNVVRRLIEQKMSEETEQDLFIRRDKVSRFLIGRGFEPDLVWEQLKREFGSIPRS